MSATVYDPSFYIAQIKSNVSFGYDCEEQELKVVLFDTVKVNGSYSSPSYEAVVMQLVSGVDANSPFLTRREHAPTPSGARWVLRFKAEPKGYSVYSMEQALRELLKETTCRVRERLGMGMVPVDSSAEAET